MPATENLEREIQSLAKEVMEKQARLNGLLRSRPAEPVKDYALRGEGGEKVRLSDVFGQRDDLIVVHNMGRGCRYCTLWADGFVGLHPHFLSRAAFVVVSPDPPEVQEEFAASRGWPFRMLSDADGFTADMGFTREKDGKTMYSPGFSTFRRRPDGSIVRIASSWFGPGDPYCGIWHMLDLLEGGTGDWAPRLSY